MDIDGSVALVTGANGGLGREFVRQLLERGAAKVYAGARRETTWDDERVVPLLLDVTDGDQVAAAVDAASDLTLLVNNAGVTGPVAPFSEVDLAAWWRTVEINLGSAVNCCRAVLPDMTAAGGGRIVNITSQAGVFRWPTVTAYSVSKAAMIKFTENLAVETARHGVRVFSFHPGLLPIGFTSAAQGRQDPPGSPEARMTEWILSERAAGRGAETEDAIADIVTLCSGRADVLTGRHLSVHDDLDQLIGAADEVVRRDLLTLRLHTAASR